MSAKQNLFASVSALALSFGFAQNMHAASCGTGANATIAVACTGPFTWTGGGLDVLSSGSIELGATGVSVGFGTSTGTLSNSGMVTGTSAGLVNSLGSIDSILNSGRIFLEGGTAIVNSGTIGRISNPGEISAINTGLFNAGSIGNLSNAGIISGAMGILDTSGTIGTLDNTSSGTISGGTTALVNAGGSFGLLTNSGLISGGAMGIMIDSGTISTIVNASGGTISGSTAAGIYNAGIYNYSGNIGTLSNSGVISGSTSGFAQYLSHMDELTNNAGGTISGDSYGVLNSSSTIVTLTNGSGGLITGGSRGISNSGTIEYLANAGRISGGTTGIRNSSGIIGTLSNQGLISGDMTGIRNISGTIGTLDNAASIAGNSDAIYIDGGILASFVNRSTGTITGVTNGFHSNYAWMSNWSNAGRIEATGLISAAGVFFEGSGSTGTVTNSGSISGGETGIRNQRTIDAFINSGELRGGHTGLFSQGAIATITNSGTILADVHDSAQAVNLSNGVFGTFTNAASGLLNGRSPNGEGILVQSSTLDLLDNYGTILGGALGVDDMGTIGTIRNAGLIKAVGEDGTAYGIYVGPSLDRLTNSGTIVGGTTSGVGIFNGGTITILSNSGLITHGGSIGGALINSGVIGTIDNSGTISGDEYAIYSVETLGTITNSGLISGNIFSSSAGNLVFVGGPIVSGTLTGGTVTNTASNVVFVSGNMLIGDNFDVGSYTVSNTGAFLRVDTTIGITGQFNQSSGTLYLGQSGEIVVSGLATVSGGTISADLPANGNYFAGNSRALIDAASGSSYAGATVSASLAGLSLDIDGTSGGDLLLRYRNTYIGGNAGSISSSGTINGSPTGFFVAASGNIGTLSNTGNIGGSSHALHNAGTIGLLDNRGSIADGTGLYNTGSIGTLTNAGLIEGSNGLENAGTIDLADNRGTISGTLNGVGVTASGTIGTLSNSGSIDATHGIANDGGIGSIVNSGRINGSQWAIFNFSTGIGTLTNSGTITGGETAIYNMNTITVLNNTGTIGAASVADSSGIVNSGRIDALNNGGLITGDLVVLMNNGGTIGSLNNSGTIASRNAIYNSGTFGPIVNSGLISGNITNEASEALTIAGGSGDVAGTLSGGSIKSTSANIVFNEGNLVLNDAIDVGAQEVVNSGAHLMLNSGIAVTGNYRQSAGVLDLGTSGSLSVSGTADITGGTITAESSESGNYLAGGRRTLTHAGAGYSYGGATITFASPTGLSAAIEGAGTTDLVAVYQNDYVGGDLASLDNTGAITGHAYGLYVAASGALGTFVNSGTISGTQYAIYSTGTLGTITNTGLISGNIRSAGVLALAGSGGTLSGGAITATGVSIAGSLKLADAINVGSGTVNAGAASIAFSSKITITGNYLQTGGALVSDVTDTTTYGALAVSGGATITNTTITLNGSAFRAGQTYTIVDASAASSYTGDTIRLSGTGRFRLRLQTAGDDLVALIGPMFGDIGTARGGPAAVIGGVLDRIADNNGLPAVVDQLSALSDDDLGRALEQAAPAEVGGGAAALQRAGLIEDLISGAVSNRIHAAQLGWSLWQEVFGGAARRDAVAGAAGYDTTAAGLVIGADNRMSDSLLVGAALSWSAGWNAGRGDVAANANSVNSLGLTAYGSWRQGALNLNGRLAIGLDHYNQHRDMTYLDDRAKASYSGRHYVVAAESGYDLDLAESFTLTPQASLRWLRLEHDGYGETSAAGMAIRSATADQVQSGLGASLAWNLQTQLGLVTPELQVAWLHDFITEPSQINATLDGISFTTTSERISADGIRIGTGLTFYQSEATSLHLEYGGEFRADYTAHGGMLQLSLKL